MRKYFKVMAGPKSIYATQCREQGFIGVDYSFDIDLNGKFPENWRTFNDQYIVEYLKRHPDKSKIAAG